MHPPSCSCKNDSNESKKINKNMNPYDVFLISMWNWLVKSRDGPLRCDGSESEDDMDAEKDSDAVVAVWHVGGHALLQTDTENKITKVLGV